jgi:hypothetical protein
MPQAPPAAQRKHPIEDRSNSVRCFCREGGTALPPQR